MKLKRAGPLLSSICHEEDVGNVLYDRNPNRVLLFQCFVESFMYFTSDAQFREFIFCRIRIDPVTQKHHYQLIGRISPRECARKSAVAEALGTALGCNRTLLFKIRFGLFETQTA